MLESLSYIFGLLFGLICAAVPVVYGIKYKLYHYSVLGGITSFAVIFFPYGIFLSIACAAVFFIFIRNENARRLAAIDRKRRIDEERERERMEKEEGVIDSRSVLRDDIWPVNLVDSMNGDKEEENEELD